MVQWLKQSARINWQYIIFLPDCKKTHFIPIFRRKPTFNEKFFSVIIVSLRPTSVLSHTLLRFFCLDLHVFPDTFFVGFFGESLFFFLLSLKLLFTFLKCHRLFLCRDSR